MSTDTPLQGGIVTLRPATMADRRKVYEWLACSDVTPAMMGLPPYPPENPRPTWEEFCADYAPHFFDGAAPEKGRSYIIETDGAPVGHINYDNSFKPPGMTELDIWMRCEAECGKGYGPDALRALTRHLHERFGITQYIIRPTARNPRAIRAYQKAGFMPHDMPHDEQVRRYGPADYHDTVVLIMEIPDGREACS